MKNQIIAGVVASLLTAAILWALGWLGRIPSLRVPERAIVAFNDTSCPTDGEWEPFDLARGRVVVGAGNMDQVDLHDKLLTNWGVSQTDGEEAHVLTEQELAPHHHVTAGSFHPQGAKEAGGYLGPTTKHSLEDGGAAVYWEYEGSRTTTVPEGQVAAHNNMPPFVALTYCQKIR